MDIGKAITEINTAYEAALLEHVGSMDVVNTCDIDLSKPFFGTEWGVAETNSHRQKWRWLGPFGQSHLFLNLSVETDYLIRVYIHTAVSGEILDALTALANGRRCAQQGHGWDGNGVLSHWCVVRRDLIAKRQGIVRITWSVLPVGRPQVLEAKDESEHPALARLIAFSRITCEPY